MVSKGSDDTVAETSTACRRRQCQDTERELLGVLEEQHGGQCGSSREREGQERKMSEEKLMAIKTWTLALKGFEQINNVIIFNTISL